MREFLHAYVIVVALSYALAVGVVAAVGVGAAMVGARLPLRRVPVAVGWVAAGVVLVSYLR